MLFRRTVTASTIAIFLVFPTVVEAQSIESVPQWEGFIDLAAAPTIGVSLPTSSGDDLVDDTELKAALRFRRTVDSLRGLRVQFQVGVTSSPNEFDSDIDESSYFGEVQLGDTYVPYSELRRGRFGTSAGDVRINTVRPYARYRFTSVHDDFLAQGKRIDHRATLGLRYRRVARIDTDPDNPKDYIRGLHFELRAELGKVWSSSNTDEHWNPSVQVDIYSPVFLNRTRFVVRVAADLSAYDDALAPNGDTRLDKRVRVSAGLDLSDTFKDWFNWKKASPQVELLGRYQQRWSNDPTKEHSRAYFVPTLSVSLPLQ